MPLDIAEQHLEFIIPTVLDMVTEDNSLIQQILWKETFYLFGKFDNKIWLQKNFQ
jgi:hypothetical protein